MKTNFKTFQKLILSFILVTAFSLTSFADENIDDQEISNTISAELLLQSDVPSYLIDVETNDGIVTLSGTTNNILAKERAEKVALAVKGVRGVVNNIELNTPEINDARLETDISNALLQDPATESYQVNVSADDGIVTLTGEVESWQEKELAAHVAKGVKGVKGVNNEITFDYEAGRSDYEIKQDIEAAMQNDVRIDNMLVDVKVNDGNVELSGEVGSATEKRQAEFLAWVSGVQSVDTENLEVSYWAREENLRKDKYVDKSDDEIKEAIKDAYIYDPRVSFFNPNVKVDNGIVTLSGTVDNLKAKRAAENTAKNIVGVKMVKNYINIRPSYIPEDEVLEEDVADALIVDPYIEKYEITVNANNGDVSIYGTVDNFFEKYHAEDIASTVYGVVNVNNNIDVDDDFAYDDDYYYYEYYDWNSYYPSTYTSFAYTSPLTDWEIKSNIESELWWSPFVNRDEVNITVDNGVATLTGEVDTRGERQAAADNAFEGGAEAVVNNLEVENE